jgi:hypothetical protein
MPARQRKRRAKPSQRRSVAARAYFSNAHFIEEQHEAERATARWHRAQAEAEAIRRKAQDEASAREQRAAERYTAKWHRVEDWVEDALTLPGFDDVPHRRLGTYFKREVDRVTRHASSRVRDLKDAEEAYDRGMALEIFDGLPAGPGRDVGGLRRVVITALTWTPDAEGEVAYDPAWITLGWGMTAKQAAAAAKRFVRNYTRASNARVVSRELIFTAIEVKFWTARTAAKYV